LHYTVFEEPIVPARGVVVDEAEAVCDSIPLVTLILLLKYFSKSARRILSAVKMVIIKKAGIISERRRKMNEKAPFDKDAPARTRMKMQWSRKATEPTSTR
jgi:hypothetical protein